MYNDISVSRKNLLLKEYCMGGLDNLVKVSSNQLSEKFKIHGIRVSMRTNLIKTFENI